MKQNVPNFRHLGGVAVNLMEGFIYGARWLLAPLYVGLVIGMGVYFLKFCGELWHLTAHYRDIPEAEIMLGLLSLVDITMVGNLILMIMVGGWHIFVQRMNFPQRNQKPGWLNHINSGTLKIKMGMSIVGVSSIHLLKVFINAEKMESWKPVLMMMSIHVLFILSTLAMGWTDKMLHPIGYSSEPEPDQHSTGGTQESTASATTHA